jgi:membrane peptidoglycan carboxypeptidase
MKWLKKILLLFTTGFLTCALGFGIYYVSVTHTVKLNSDKLLMPETQICAYDKDGNLLPCAGSFEHRRTIEINELPAYLPAAFVNTEDKRFYKHNGFDLIGICRAALKNTKSKSFKEGASTISQQLVKNTHLTLDKTISRKLKEFKLTQQLEKKYSKQEILEIYLNTIYFGHNCYGIENAATFYFNKSARELDVAESALLAGLVKAPNHYSPFKNPEKAYARRRTVLGLMKEQNSIDEPTYKNAIDAPLPATFSKNSNKTYLHFALQEMDEILEDKEVLPHGKIEIHTYYSPSIQDSLNELYSSFDSDKTFMIVNNETHGIEGYYSTVSNIKRSPGSLIKPLLVYAPAFEEGQLSPASPILDEATDFNGYSPKNYHNKYYGYVSTRDAIAKSLNVPAVKTLNALTLSKANEYASKMDLSIPKNDQTLAYALGGMEHGYSFQALVDGYSTLANAGMHTKSSFIKEIKINGMTVYNAPNNIQCVYSPETAYLITDVLKSAVSEGTAKKLRRLPFAVAAKTGTVGTGKKNTDAYTVAYTSEHTVGVWLGNADNREIDTTGGGAPCDICSTLLERLYSQYLPDDFVKPTQIQEITIDKYYYDREQRILLADTNAPMQYQKRELFARQFSPKEQSTLFSSPIICKPTVSVFKNTVSLEFDKNVPDGYGYRIFRIENGKSTLVYEGKAIAVFQDKHVKGDTLYEYTVIPYYRKNEGKSVTLPAVYLENYTPPIADKPWWAE